MVREFPDIFKEVHKRKYLLDETHTSIMEWLNKKIEKGELTKADGEAFGSFNPPNFTRHFNDHLKSLYDVRITLSKNGVDISDLVSPSRLTDMEIKEEKVKLMESNPYYSEFVLFDKYSRGFEETLKRYFEKMDLNKSKEIDLDELNKGQEAFNKFIRNKSAISDFKRSTQIVQSYVTNILEKFLTSYMDIVENKSNKIKSVLMPVVESERVIKEIESILLNEIGAEAAIKSAEIFESYTKENRI